MLLIPSTQDEDDEEEEDYQPDNEVDDVVELDEEDEEGKKIVLFAIIQRKKYKPDWQIKTVKHTLEYTKCMFAFSGQACV